MEKGKQIAMLTNTHHSPVSPASVVAVLPKQVLVIDRTPANATPAPARAITSKVQRYGTAAVTEPNQPTNPTNSQRPTANAMGVGGAAQYGARSSADDSPVGVGQ